MLSPCCQAHGKGLGFFPPYGLGEAQPRLARFRNQLFRLRKRAKGGCLRQAVRGEETDALPTPGGLPSGERRF
ncbi:hypothetical protein DFJ66_6194 [Saccharothrix variisporea]|uniref:Uncharacterized protein n=1 Tax=Saccharothrix variisporea TaxID=543527 RepID=A0A495XF25_9PSEU|nr:hypothetical protein DFJ66_6194 [Saccharothrix variisporea]